MNFDSDDASGPFTPMSGRDRHTAGGWHESLTPVPVADRTRDHIIRLVSAHPGLDRISVRERLLAFDGIEATVDEIRTVFAEIGFDDCREGCAG